MYAYFCMQLLRLLDSSLKMLSAFNMELRVVDKFVLSSYKIRFSALRRSFLNASDNAHTSMLFYS